MTAFNNNETVEVTEVVETVAPVPVPSQSEVGEGAVPATEGEKEGEKKEEGEKSEAAPVEHPAETPATTEGVRYCLHFRVLLIPYYIRKP